MGVKNFVRSAIRRGYAWVFPPFFWTVPIRWGFALLVLADVVRFPGTFFLSRLYASIIVRRVGGKPAIRFSSALTGIFPLHAARILMWMGAFPEGVDILAHSHAATRSERAAALMAALLFELAEFARAREVLAPWYSGSHTLYQRGLLELIAGHEKKAVPFLVSAGQMMPHLMRPHQNLAARDSINYVPNSLDRAAGYWGRLYDAYNYIGQRVTHVGAGDIGAKLYAGALKAQEKLRSSWPSMSVELQTMLSDCEIPARELRILPAEWVTQIGHQGMMDILFRMRELGWWDGKAVVLAPRSRIANHPMLSLFEDRCKIFVTDPDLGRGLFAELSSLQRYCGMSFNVFELPGGDVVPWQEAGALAMRQWEAERRGDPLRDEYDRRFGAHDRVLAGADEVKKRWGMAPDDWHVCLHLRDASHYDEMEGTGQTHRNAEVSQYVPMIEHITRHGGWVIKLGGPRSPKLPQMRRVIDYARSRFKSNLMDLHFIRHARYFVGTTSGLTNVAISFGVPCALINCITVDAQLWSDRVRFAPKRVVTAGGRMLGQRELTSAPWRWRVFSAEAMLRYGVLAQQNSADEILETVKEVELLAVGSAAPCAGKTEGTADLLGKWRMSLGLPHFYGNAQPSAYYLGKYEREFLEV